MFLGDTMSGSSGAPAWIGDGIAVGQLRSACGPRPEDTCDAANRTVDGSFAMSYPILKAFIDPSDTGSCPACISTSETACLLGGRFKVTMKWTNRFANPVTSGTGKVIKYAENKVDSNPQYGPTSEVLYLSMFDSSPTAVETIVRIINGVGINDKYWIYVTGFSNNEYTVSVTDTKTCKTWTRTNPFNTFGIITDQQAFPLN